LKEAVTAAVSGAGRTKVEDDLLGVSHLSAQNEKEKEKERGAERGARVEAGWAAARSWAPGAAQLGCAFLFSLFFCSNSFFISALCFIL
jgi:hypothetical protein